MLRWLSILSVVFCAATVAAAEDSAPDLWVLKPVVRPAVPKEAAKSANPIDAFIRAEYRAKGLTPVGPADKRTLLRRVYLDLIGLPPSPAEQEAFLADSSADAYEKVVDRLLASPQYGVRYARHWLDVLRYADVDEHIVAAPGLYLWRDWVINALNDDVPYDQFVRAQLTGFRSTERTFANPNGKRKPLEPRPADLFALGLLARGEVLRDPRADQQLALSAVETVSSAFMGLTVACAKCHDHMYDPIKQSDFYAMKALFDPLVVRKHTLATPAEIFANGRALDAAEKRCAELQSRLDAIDGPVKKKLYEQRLTMVPAEVRAAVLKPEADRTAAERKLALDYFPVLRIDDDKIKRALSDADRIKFKQIEAELEGANDVKRHTVLPAFWTVEVDPLKKLEKSYILTSGDPDRPEKEHEVQPGWPFAPAKIDFSEGPVEAFSDWLTAPANPLLARVAVNRLWQWHFGEGLQRTPSDFGAPRAGTPSSNPALLDWLAAEFVSRGFSMKQMNRLIVTSDTYKLASEADTALMAANSHADASDEFLWHFRLRRLEAEPIWDSILAAAGNLDLTVGGPSFGVKPPSDREGTAENKDFPPIDPHANRRAAYMFRGYMLSRDIMPSFLKTFDVDDGHAPCPMRTQTVTAPQALFMMNSDEVEQASARFAERLEKQCGGDLSAAVESAYRTAIGRPPSARERDKALAYLKNDPARLKGFTWLLFNLDEFIYVR